MSRVNISSIWGSAPTFLTDPGGVKVATGWVNEGGIANWQNWWQNRVDNTLEEMERRGISIYSAGTVYYQGGLAIGSDDLLYQAVVADPGVDPVGAPAGNWIIVHNLVPYTRTVLTASDAAWVPTPGSHSFKLTITGGGGAGGGGTTGTGSQNSVGGGGGGTSMAMLFEPFAASYAIVVGAGGVGDTGFGPDGEASSFDVTIIGGGGVGGSNIVGNGDLLPGASGGGASGGDQDCPGGDSSVANATGSNRYQFSQSGASIWGGGLASSISGQDGEDGVSHGVGGGAIGSGTGNTDGGNGAAGVVVIEEHF